MNLFIRLSFLSLLFVPTVFAATPIKDSTCDLPIASQQGVHLLTKEGFQYTLSEQNLSILQKKGYNAYFLDIDSASDEELKSIKLHLGLKGSVTNSGYPSCLICFGNAGVIGEVALELKRRIQIDQELKDEVLVQTSSDLKNGSQSAIETAFAKAAAKLPNCIKQ